MQRQQRQQTSRDENTSTAMLYQRYAPAIFAYLRRQMPTREDAEDTLVEVFLAALENATFFALAEKEQAAWLWRVAHNKMVDAYRRASRRQSVQLDEVAETVFDSDEHAPEQLALLQEEYALLQSRLKCLSPLQQEVLELRFASEMRCAEIAAHMGKHEGAIRIMLSRALNLLRDIYQKSSPIVPPKRS